MEKYQTFGTKSKTYIFCYILGFLISIVLIILVLIPILTIGPSFLYIFSLCLFLVFFLLDIAFLINYLSRPSILLEISDDSLRINRRKRKKITIPFLDIESSTIGIGFFGVFMRSSGNIKIKTKNNKVYNIGYLEDFNKIFGQINSIKFINEIKKEK